jgi:hypothetical protein
LTGANRRDLPGNDVKFATLREYQIIGAMDGSDGEACLRFFLLRNPAFADAKPARSKCPADVCCSFPVENSKPPSE